MSDELSSAANDDVASTALTVAEYRAQAAAICEAADKRNDRIPWGSLAEGVDSPRKPRVSRMTHSRD